MKKHIIIALLLLMAASPAAAATGLPAAVRADVKTEVKADVRLTGQERSTERSSDFWTRLDRIEVRIEALIKRLEAKKIDMTASKAAFADFSAKLEISKKNLADLSAFLNVSGGATIDKDQLAAKRKVVRQSLQDAHVALKLTVKEIAKAIREAKANSDMKVRADVNASVQAN